MKALLQFIMALVIVVSVGAGLYFISVGLENKKANTNNSSESKDTKQARQIRSYITKIGKPQRIEVETLTERLKSQVDDIKQMRMPLDSNSKFYIRIQFFTDENDQASPLIAQFRVFDVATDNLISEESLNLEQ